MKATTALRLPRQWIRSRVSLRRAERRGLEGGDFARFGFRLGRLALLRGHLRTGLQYALTPVSIVRYFELPFAWSWLPPEPAHCLDVSSPRLFTLFTAHHRGDRVHMINPDRTDLKETRSLLAAAGVADLVTTEEATAADLPASNGGYGVVWSLSVIEHIAGDTGDTEAVGAMMDALDPGGRLILTFPVDQTYREEFMEFDPYGTQPRDPTGRGFFYQRFYDLESIERRLLRPLGLRAAAMRWFGEKEAGFYARYEERWFSEGRPWVVDDPLHVVEGFTEYESFDRMPGMGVCGLMVEKR